MNNQDGADGKNQKDLFHSRIYRYERRKRCQSYLNWHFHKQIVFWKSSFTFNLQHHTGTVKVEVHARDSHSPGRTAFFSHLATDPCLHMELAPHLLSRMLTCLCSILSASRKAQCHKKPWHSIYIPAVPDSYHSAPPCRQIFHSLSPFTRTNLAKSRDNSAPALPFSSLSSPYKSGLMEERTQILRETWFVAVVQTINYQNWSPTTGPGWCWPVCTMLFDWWIYSAWFVLCHPQALGGKDTAWADTWFRSRSHCENKKRKQTNVAAVLLQEAYELWKLHVGMAFIVVDRAESNFTKSSHDT